MKHHLTLNTSNDYNALYNSRHTPNTLLNGHSLQAKTHLQSPMAQTFNRASNGDKLEQRNNSIPRDVRFTNNNGKGADSSFRMSGQRLSASEFKNSFDKADDSFSFVKEQAR